MEWLDRLIELFASREWMLLMLICIAMAAFAFPDYQLLERLVEKGKDDQAD